MIDPAAIEAAAAAIAPHVHRTPVVSSATLAREVGATVHLKLELLQKTGSFKPRGAVNQLLDRGTAARDRGAVGVSGGNFAQGLAYAGQRLGVDTLIVMPENTPANYVDATRGYGATVEFAPDVTAAFDAVARHVEVGRVGTHPFDDPAMMAGNGSLGLELVQQVPDLTDLVISVGGGGFLTGVVSAVLALRPGTRIWPVETEGADVLARSIQAGEPVRMVPTSIARTLGSPYVAEAAFELAREHAQPVSVVPDAEAIAAMRLLFERAKVVAEPAAACTVAALRHLAGGFPPGSEVVAVLCGGNVAASDFAGWLSSAG